MNINTDRESAIVRDAEMRDELQMLEDNPREYYEGLRKARLAFGFSSSKKRSGE